MMEKFADQYVVHNPGVFSSAETAYMLAYLIIMLNTDAHKYERPFLIRENDILCATSKLQLRNLCVQRPSARKDDIGEVLEEQDVHRGLRNQGRIHGVHAYQSY